MDPGFGCFWYEWTLRLRLLVSISRVAGFLGAPWIVFVVFAAAAAAAVLVHAVVPEDPRNLGRIKPGLTSLLVLFVVLLNPQGKVANNLAAGCWEDKRSNQGRGRLSAIP